MLAGQGVAWGPMVMSGGTLGKCLFYRHRRIRQRMSGRENQLGPETRVEDSETCELVGSGVSYKVKKARYEHRALRRFAQGICTGDQPLMRRDGECLRFARLSRFPKSVDELDEVAASMS